MLSLPALRSRLDTPFAPLLITALLFAAFLGLYIQHQQVGISYLIRVGDQLAHYGPVPGDPYIHPGRAGYDGIFFYRLALDPFTQKRIDKGIKIDDPGYRQARVLYPLLARLLGMGQPRWIIRALFLINYLSVCALGFLGGIYAKEKGQHALWGLTVSLTSSALLVCIVDTAELLSVALTLIALRALDRRRFGWGASWCTLAVLTRESTMILPFAALAATVVPPLWTHVFPRRLSPNAGSKAVKGNTSVALLLIPFVIYALWSLRIHQVWGLYPWDYATGRLGIPFLGIYGAMRYGVAMDLRPGSPVSLFHIEYIVGFALLCALAMRTSQASPTLKISWLILASMAMCYTYPLIFCYDMDYFRVLTDFFTLGALVLIASPSRLKVGALAISLAVLVSIAADHLGTRW